MTRLLQFSDGFTSASAPSIIGGPSQEDFVISNAALGTTLLTFDSAIYKSIFFNFTLERSDVGSTFVQNGKGIIGFDGTDWSITFGNFQDSDMVTDETPLVEQVKFYMTTALGVGSLKYDSGTMGSSYFGNILFSFTRIMA